jgi:hypothetical protein
MPNVLPDDHVALTDLDYWYQNLREMLARGLTAQECMKQMMVFLSFLTAAFRASQVALANTEAAQSAEPGQLSLPEVETPAQAEAGPDAIGAIRR